MSEEYATALNAISSKLDKLTEKISGMEKTVTGTLAEHSTRLTRLEEEKKQIFEFINKDIKATDQLSHDNKHRIENLDRNNVSMAKELTAMMDELRKNTTEDLVARKVGEDRINSHNKLQNWVMTALGLALSALAVYTSS